MLYKDQTIRDIWNAYSKCYITQHRMNCSDKKLCLNKYINTTIWFKENVEGEIIFSDCYNLTVDGNNKILVGKITLGSYVLFKT